MTNTKINREHKSLLLLPAPEYIVFYNGLKEEPDRKILKLSDAFLPQNGKDFALECRATLLNINFGHNQKLMEGCRKLYEYSCLIAKIREFLKKGLTVTAAINAAVEFCITHNILADFLKKHRMEVNQMILTEYNEELHIRSEKAISYKEGEQHGIQKATVRINALTSRLIEEKRYDELKRATENPAFQQELLKEYGIE